MSWRPETVKSTRLMERLKAGKDTLHGIIECCMHAWCLGSAVITYCDPPRCRIVSQHSRRQEACHGGGEASLCAVDRPPTLLCMPTYHFSAPSAPAISSKLPTTFDRYKEPHRPCPPTGHFPSRPLRKDGTDRADDDSLSQPATPILGRYHHQPSTPRCFCLLLPGSYRLFRTALL